MRTLFLKIFFSFWLTIVLMGVPFYFIGLKNRPDHPHPAMHDFSMQAMARYGDEALSAWHQGGQEKLRAFTERIEQQSGISLYLFAGQGNPLSGRKAPDRARDLVNRILTGEGDKPPRPPGPGPRDRWIGRLLDQGDEIQGQPLIIVLKLPEPPHPPSPPPGRPSPLG